MLCTISPSICRVELYRLGYVYDPRTQKQGRANQVEPVPRPKTTNLIDGMPSVIVRALIVGSKVSGSAALIQKFHGKTNLLDTSSDYPETSCAVLKILLPEHGNSSKDETKVETAVHLILTRMPLDKDINNTSQQTKLVCLLEKGVYDLALLVYDSSDSFDSVKHFEATMLNDKMPRIFVSTSPDHIPEAIDHCQVTKMDPPRFVAVDKSQTDSDLVEFLVNFAKRPRRNTSKRRKLIWLGGLVTAGITVVIGFTIGRKKKADGSEKSWFKCLLDLMSY
jgi:Ras family protein T1